MGEVTVRDGVEADAQQIAEVKRRSWQADGTTRIEDLGGPRETIVRYRRNLSTSC